MSFVHDVIKIMYVGEGYLPNYPTHLTSDNEMVDAFLKIAYPVTDEVWEAFMEDDTVSFFKDTYPCPDETVEEQYRALVSSIAYYVSIFKSSTEDGKTLPDWVYAYMLGEVISPMSKEEEQEYLFDLLGMTQLNVTFDGAVASKCYTISDAWLRKTSNVDKERVPTVFGEPHVIKALRLTQIDKVVK